MNPSKIFAIVLLTIALPALGQSAAPPPHLGDNAALDYWQATYFMRGWDERDWKIVDGFDAPRIDRAAAAKVLDSTIAHLVRRAAEQPWCDWGLRLDLDQDGPRALLPYLNCSRRMAELLLLDARVKIEDGNSAAAAHDWICALSVGRHAGCNGVVVALLVDLGIEAMTVRNAALDLPRLDKSARQDLAAALSTLPIGGTLVEAVNVQQEINQRWIIRQLRQNHGQENAQQVVSDMLTPGGSPAEVSRGEAALAASGGTIDGLVTRLQNLDPLYARIAAAVALPYQQFQNQWPAIQRDLDADPVAQIAVIGGYPRWVRSHAEAQCLLAMFAAAIDVVDHGPEALRNHPDPFGAGPFAYQANPRGFELNSKLTDEAGKPISLTVGRD
jgi:hypothetical protein